MPTQRLVIDGEPVWEFSHNLPPLWYWLFDPAVITESRRLYATVFDAAARFQANRLRAGRCRFFAEVFSCFEEVAPDRWPRDLGCQPDAVIMLDLMELERTRPILHERTAEAMERFLAACESGEDRAALAAWEVLLPGIFPFSGGRQRDALLLARRAEDFGLRPEDRAMALVWMLFGRPVSRAARALDHGWGARARELSFARYTERVPLWRRFLG